MPKCAFAGIVLLVVLPIVAIADDLPATDSNPGQKVYAEIARRVDQFSLFNDCRPMALRTSLGGSFAGDLASDEPAKGIEGINEELIRDLAEKRLRLARLYLPLNATQSSDGKVGAFERAMYADAWMYVNVSVSGTIFQVSVEYYKKFTDSFGRSGLARTWNTAFLYSHAKDSWFVIGVLSDQIDQFLSEYLRVNEAACEGK